MAEDLTVLTINQHETLLTRTALNKINILAENSDLSGANEVHKKMNLGAMGIYQKPASGIPDTDLTPEVQADLELARGSVQSSEVETITQADINGLWA